jgi:energy-converting hydrogenase Eha subunit C
MGKFLSRTAQTVSTALESTRFFLFSLVILVLNALWWAVTAIYPLPFDEYYHFGIIQIYAEQWLPFIAQQPPEASLYGDITRYPSYLYHYLMSFPYRVLDLFIDSEELMIVMLRGLNIALMVLAVYLFWRFFLDAGVSKKIVNATIFFFACTPIVPFVAAHINYDNLLLVITAVVLRLSWHLIHTKRVDTRRLLLLISMALLGSIVKETFLPIAITACVYPLIVLGNRYKGKLVGEALKDLKRLSTTTVIALVTLFVLSFGLFAERYAVNQLSYGDWQASCETIQSVETCEDYMPWYRNQQNKLNPAPEELYGNPLSFSQHWISKITRGYYAVFSHTPTEVVWDKEPFGPIVNRPLTPVPALTAIASVIIGVIAIVLQRRRLWKSAFYRYLFILTLIYSAVVWAFNYSYYLDLGIAQAIQARYFLPVLPIMFVIALQALAWSARRFDAKYLLLGLIMLLYLWYGGAVAWIIRADPTWYWQNDTIINTGQTAKDILQQTHRPY